MATTSLKLPHVGRKIERVRILKGMKQEALADKIGVSQQTISRIENSETVEEDKLKQIAEALDMSVEGLISFNEDATVNNISNTYNNQDSSINSIFYYQMGNTNEVRDLYEKLLASEKEKVSLMEELLKQYRGKKG
jgi:transcriptional regulator with XRE-family HTH domain